MDWLPGAIQLKATSDGGPQDKSYPPRLVLHTTEGTGTVEDLYNFYKNTSGYWPNMTVDLARHQIAQHIPFSRGGKALQHTDSTQTNDANCIQIEIIGYATQSPTWPVAAVQWLGRELQPMLDALGIRRYAPKFVAYPASAGYYWPGRFSEAYWRQFNGVCGHEHVPENDHGDPGAMNVTALLIASILHPEVKVQQEFVPPHPTRPEVSDVDCPGGGAWGVTGDGAVQTHGSAPFHGGPYGQSYWTGQGKTAARIELPDATLDKGGPGHYTVIATDGSRYRY